MNAVYINIFVSIAVGIALAAVAPLRKTPLRWLGAFTALTVVILTLTFLDLRQSFNFLLGSELTLILFGALSGPAIYLGLGAPTKSLMARISAGILTGTIALGTAVLLSNYLTDREDGRPLPPELRHRIQTRAEQILQANLTATVENTTGIKRRLHGEYADPKVGNPAVFIAENFSDDAVQKKVIGPLYRTDIVGKPSIKNLRLTERLIEENPSDVIIANGSVELTLRLTPFYHNRGKPTWDRSVVINQTEQFEATFVLRDDLELIHFKF